MTAPLRFVHVFATFGAGGPQIRAVQLMRRLGERARHVVVAMDGDTQARAQLPTGVDVQFAAPAPRRGTFGVVVDMRRWLRQQQPQLVLTYNWGAIEAVLAARLARLPLVHHEDGFLPDEAVRRKARRTWLRRLSLRSVPVVVPSSGLATIARDEWWMKRAAHVPNGVDLQRFAPAARAPGQRLVVGTVGGLRPEKDHATLLRAFAALADCELHLVGDGALREPLRALVAELGLQDRVVFAGATDDTAPWYRRFDVFVSSSRTEQMPLVLLEAMASGLPVVATDVGDVRKVLAASAAPFVVAREQPAALADALRAVLVDEGLRRRLGEDNRRRVEAEYGAAVCQQRFLDLYLATAR